LSAALRRGRPDDAGFTLLELLVAVFVMGVVLILLTQGVQFGLRATQLQAGVRDRKGDLEVVDHALRRMIALADPGVYPEPATLRGTAQKMSFTTELPIYGSGPTQWADVALSAETGRLLLRWTPHRHVEPLGPRPQWQDVVVLEGVQRIELAYRAPGASSAWSGTWSADRLPALVRIHVVFADGSGRRWPPLLVAPIREALEE